MVLVLRTMIPRWSVAATFLLLSCSKFGVVVQASWTLIHQEDFTTALDQEAGAAWELETYAIPFDTIMDDSGDWYRNDYGDDAFNAALSSFDTYRKEFPIGKDGWLTASLSVRDSTKNAILDAVLPELFIETLNDAGNVLTMNVKEHTGGVLLRPTKALPESYRIEYKLKFLDFGGKKKGNIQYEDDGRINGYSPEGCKTQHPWGEGSGSKGWEGDASAPYCEWQGVREGPYGYNGFAFLSIVDFADPAPRNNHFWHYKRKILMDSFSVHPDRVGTGSGGQVCDAATNQYYDYKDSESWTTVNMWISGLPSSWSPNPGELAGNSQHFITQCNGKQATKGLQSAGELQPEFLPDQFYTFAIERNSTGYTMEASGFFARSGFRTFRFFRPFVVDNVPIWHYNVKASEYDGRYNSDLKQENWAHGSQTWSNQWPAGSAYPDYFVIGDYYTNGYEGRASLTDIRYYEPDSLTEQCEPTILLASGTELVESRVVQTDDTFLLLRANGDLQVWRGMNGQREHLLWQTGKNGHANDSYVALLQGDGNLVVSKKAVSDGQKTTVWKSSSVNSNGKYYLVLDCEAKGNGLAIYNGLPGQGGYPVWIKDTIPPPSVVINAPVTPPPTSKPVPPPTPKPVSVSAPVPTLSPVVASEVAVACNPRMFLERYERVSTEQSIIYPDVSLTQRSNGNLQVRRNNPSNRGQVIWETGISDSTEANYYTVLQGDCNLITWKVMQDEDTKTVVWKSGTTVPDGGLCFLVLDCVGCSNTANVAVYQGGLPNNGGTALWTPPPPRVQVCTPAVFLGRDERISKGQFIVRCGVFMTQLSNGNVQVRRNTPSDPGSLVWESGVNDSSTLVNYHTVLQGDGNLITWKVKIDGSKPSPIWSTGITRENGNYFLVLDCAGAGSVAIYQGLPEEGGTASWEPSPTSGA